jgi:deoxycytidylate deaminase
LTKAFEGGILYIMHKHLELALKRASSHVYDPNADYHLCALIVRGGSVISVGYNRRSTNAFVEHYTDQVRGCGRGYSLSTHAEMDAVAQARDKTDLTGCKIYVARRRMGDGTTGLARPCEICQTVLWSYGIRKAYYTIDNENFGVMKVIQHNITDSVVSSSAGDQ